MPLSSIVHSSLPCRFQTTPKAGHSLSTPDRKRQEHKSLDSHAFSCKHHQISSLQVKGRTYSQRAATISFAARGSRVVSMPEVVGRTDSVGSEYRRASRGATPGLRKRRQDRSPASKMSSGALAVLGVGGRRYLTETLHCCERLAAKYFFCHLLSL